MALSGRLREGRRGENTRVRGWGCHHRSALSKTHALRLIPGHCTARATSTFPVSILSSVPSIDTDGACSRSFSVRTRDRSRCVLMNVTYCYCADNRRTTTRRIFLERSSYAYFEYQTIPLLYQVYPVVVRTWIDRATAL